MKLLRFKILAVFLLSLALFNTGFFAAEAITLASSLSGRILLQVQDQGQAWYVNPTNLERYYLGRPDDAFSLMRSLGLGVSNTDLSAFFKSAPRRLAGRILLQVQDKGQAYYLDPVDLKFYYLGRPTDAFSVMRARGLGITNSDLSKIPVASGNADINVAPPAPLSGNVLQQHFTFKYQTSNYDLTQPLSENWYNTYRNSPKVYSYPAGQEPANSREIFYGLFLAIKSGDTSLDNLISQLRALVNNQNWSEDQLVELTMALVQYIPYDTSKLSATELNINPFFPYETLYLDRGVCSDKTFLAVALLRRLGYGAAILDFPDLDHTAVGLACPLEYSVKGSGYCYVETTNYFPLGVIPSSINSGQVTNDILDMTRIFSDTNLGTMEIYQKTSGKIYNRISLTHQTAASIIGQKNNLEASRVEVTNSQSSLAAQLQNIDALKAQLDVYYNSNQMSQYNALVPEYNNAVNQYNLDIATNQTLVSNYNQLVTSYNQAARDFYQQ
jgi:hypothetical protein